MQNLKSKEKHSYRVSYAYDVGDSFDPDMENIDEWVTNTHGTRLHPGLPLSLTPADMRKYRCLSLPPRPNAFSSQTPSPFPFSSVLKKRG